MRTGQKDLILADLGLTMINNLEELPEQSGSFLTNSKSVAAWVFVFFFFCLKRKAGGTWHLLSLTKLYFLKDNSLQSLVSRIFVWICLRILYLYPFRSACYFQIVYLFIVLWSSAILVRRVVLCQHISLTHTHTFKNKQTKKLQNCEHPKYMASF